MSSISFAAAIQSLAAAVSAAASDFQSATQMLSQLAATTMLGGVAPSTSAATAQAVTMDLMRRSAVIELALASSNYTPTSYDDAVSAMEQVCSLLDQEIQIAGDQGEDTVYLTLRTLRAAVAKDLTSRGASLAPVVTITTNHSLPAPVLAQRLYRDPTRADELVTRANSPHPAFMPVSFKGLAK